MAEQYGAYIVRLGRCFACQQPVDEHHLIIDVSTFGRSDVSFYKCPPAKKKPEEIEA